MDEKPLLRKDDREKWLVMQLDYMGAAQVAYIFFLMIYVKN